MSAYVFSAVLAAILVGSILWLLRRRQMSEKYAAVWILLGTVVLIFVIFPGLAFALADALGIATPINLLVVSAIVVLLLVAIHLSVSLTAAEERSRTLTEEIALLRHDLGQLAQRVPEGGGSDGSQTSQSDTDERGGPTN